VLPRKVKQAWQYRPDSTPQAKQPAQLVAGLGEVTAAAGCGRPGVSG